MTKEQFDLKYRGENVAVHCDTEEKAKAYFALEDSFGTVWGSGEKLSETDWDCYKKETCYSLFKDGTIVFGDLKWYKSEGYKIVEFELDEPNGYAIEDTPSPMKETFSVGDVVYDNNGAKAVVKRLFYELEYEDGHCFKKAHETLTHTKPLKKITEKELADMGYVLVK